VLDMVNTSDVTLYIYVGLSCQLLPIWACCCHVWKTSPKCYNLGARTQIDILPLARS